MGWLVLLIVIVAVSLAVVFIRPYLVSSKASDVSKQEYAYQIRGALLTASEIQFYHDMKEAIGDQFVIFGKVRVADVLAPKTGLSKSHWQRAFNKISAKHFDFVLCNPENLDVEIVIELDDKSHRKSSRMDRDNFLNQACASSGLKMLRFPVKASYSISEIKSEIF